MSAEALQEPVPDGLRTRTARGTIVNAVFLIGLQGISFLKGFVVAAFLTAQQYGVWGLLVVSLGTLLWIAQVGIDAKYIQQDEPDQERAFQHAFTAQSVLAGVMLLLLAVGIPLFAVIYDQPAIIAPGLVLMLAIPTAALVTPRWAYYRRMEFATQRRLEAWDPVTSFVVTCALAVAGAGYWSLVVGTVVGGWAGAIVAVRHSPYPLRFRYDREALRAYAAFSWPIMLSSASGLAIAQVPVLVAQRHLGTAAVGAIALAGTIALYANRVDEIVTQTLYPAVARVKDRTDLLYESFVKSNRLAMLWGVPCGVGIALFAGDLVHFVLGESWRFAVPVIQIVALTAGFNQFAFNWDAFYRALGRTRPIAVASAAMLVAVIGLSIPLILLDGVRGYAIGMAGATVVLIAVRVFYVLRLFPTFSVIAHVLRGLAPAAPAAALVGLLRAVESSPRSGAMAAGELVLYVGVVAGATLMSERALLREIAAYLRGRPAPPAAA